MKRFLLRRGIRVGLVCAPSVTFADKDEQNRVPTVAAPGASRRLVVDGVDEFSCIFVGGGTAGCTGAYLLAKWMEDFNIPGQVLLIDRGVSFDPRVGPSPKLDAWYENWSEFGECHESFSAKDGRAYPVVPTDHRGLGGCSTHDTRITFQLREEQKKRISKEMNWTSDCLDEYFQTALNFMPLSPAIDKWAPIPFYSAVIESLTKGSSVGSEQVLSRLPDDEHKSGIIVDSIASSSLAMYGREELRWTPAYLLMNPSIRPSNLKIVTEAIVDKIEFGKGVDNVGAETEATGVLLRVGSDVNGDSGSLLTAKIVPGAGTIALMSGAIGNPAILQRSGCGPGDFLSSIQIPVIIDNPYIGHGVDHEEVAVLFQWLDKWNTESGTLPRGGAMGWPLVLFASFRPEYKDVYGGTPVQSSYFQAHFGAGYAEPYTAFPSVVATPNCLRPDHSESGGYRVFIRSKNPSDSCILKQGDHRKDLETIAQGVFSVTKLFQRLYYDGIVGPQLEPPFEVNEGNKDKLIDWIMENHYTVFHWACTCQAGMNGRVADSQFRLRSTGAKKNNAGTVVRNLYVGSAASLPELSENNPHLTITAFAVALAEVLAKDLAAQNNRDYTRMRMLECTRASHELKIHRTAYDLKTNIECANSKTNSVESLDKALELSTRHGLSTIIRRVGEERPALGDLAREHYASWQDEHR